MYSVYLVARRLFVVLALTQIIDCVLVRLAGMISAILTGDIVLVTSSLMLTRVCTNIGFTAFVLRKYNLATDKGIDEEVRSYGLKLIPAYALNFVRNRIAQLSVGMLSGFSDLASFAVADGILGYSKQLFPLTTQVLFADFAQKEETRLYRFLKNNFLFIFGGALLVSGLMIGAGSLYIHFSLPKQYGDSIIYLVILMLSLPALALLHYYTTIAASHMNRNKIAKCYYFNNLLDIVLVPIACYSFGVIGLSIITVVNKYIALLFSVIVFHNISIRNLVRAKR
jgi:O-antigen/teichoic acid export membrane protein